MKFRITMKTPDVLDGVLPQPSEYDGECDMKTGPCKCGAWHGEGKFEPVRDNSDDIEAADVLVKKYLKYGELLTVEFDTDAQTATVIPV